MNRIRKAKRSLLGCAAAATLLMASVHVPAQVEPSRPDFDPGLPDVDDLNVTFPTVPTTNVGARMAPQQCVITNATGRMSGAGPQVAKLIAVRKEWWVSSSSSANPQVGYKLWLGLENPRGFPTWTPQVRFDLVEVRRDIAAGESAAALLGGRGASRSILMPSSPILPGQQAKGQSPIELVVAGRQRPAWWVKATDIKSGQLLGLCNLDDMTIVNRDAVGGAAGAIEPQPLPSRSAATAAPSPTPARATPNWGELKSPQ